MTKTVNAIDISEFQDPSTFDYQAVKDAGIDTLIIRGSVYHRQDKFAKQHVANAKKYGFKWHLYHYFYGGADEYQVAIDNAEELGLTSGQYLFWDMEDKSLPSDWNGLFAQFRQAVGNTFKVGLYCSDSPYKAKFKDSQLQSLGVMRWIASYSYEPANYDIWQMSGAGGGGFGSYQRDVDRDYVANVELNAYANNDKPFVPPDVPQTVKSIILKPMLVNGIYGLGNSLDNGVTNKIYWTIYGRKYYQEDADHLWPFLIDKIKETTGGSLNISWNDIQNKPDVATQADLKNIELKPGSQGPKGDKGDTGTVGQQGPQGLPGKDGVTPHIDSTTGNWFIGSTDTGIKAQGPQGVPGQQGEPGVPGTNGKDGIDGKDGQPGRDGADGKSAYQIWLDNGHSGTEADFLNSLKGAKGDPGKDGQNGADGKDGAPGRDGTEVDLSGYATKQAVEQAQTTADNASKYASDDAKLIKQLSNRVDAIKMPDLSDYAKTSEIPTDVVTHAELDSVATKIDTSSQYTNKKPSDYPDGIFYEVKSISALSINRSRFDSSAQTGSYGLVTTKVVTVNGTKFAHQKCEVLDSQRLIIFLRHGYSNNWTTWELNQTWS